MMGTADALPIEPMTKTTFVEDMTENQLAKAVSVFLSCNLLSHIAFACLLVLAVVVVTDNGGCC